MTALTEFQRLEAQGSWRETPDAQLREVIVSVGEATLVLSDPKSDRPLTHWSLPAVTRLNPGKMPAVYAPGSQRADETVEIDDPLMIDAIARVQRAISLHRTHPGRLRGALTILTLVAVLAALVFWLPDAIIRHAAKIAPPAQARQIGQAVLSDIENSTGKICTRKSGQAVLDWLSPRLVDGKSHLRVVPGPLNGALRLPGDLYVLGGDLLVSAPGPEAAAGHVIAASLASDDREVTLGALQYAGLGAVLRLMTLGDLPSDAMAGYGEKLLSRNPPRPDDAALLEQLAQRGLGSDAYARTIDPTGAAVPELIENDPARTAPPGPPLLTDPQWLALQQICAG